MLKVGSKWCVTMMSLSLLSVSSFAMTAECGPGNNWVDKCESGLDQASSEATVSIDLVDPTTGLPADNPFDVKLYDVQTKIFRGAPQDGVIKTEMVSLHLTGPISPPLMIGENVFDMMTIRAGDGEADLNCNGPLCSFGTVKKQAADSSKADSDFEVDFEVSLSKLDDSSSDPFTIRVCDEKHRVFIEGIKRLPPLKVEYVPRSDKPIPLCDATGKIVGYLTDSRHVLIPPTPKCVCGHKAHWVDDCPAGTDKAPSRALITVEIPCEGEIHMIPFQGPTEIERQAGSPHSIDIEIQSMLLKDPTETYSIIAGSAYGLSSPGQITETLSNPWLANIDFNIFFEINTPIGKLHNKEPHEMGVKNIACLPPIDKAHIPPADVTTPLYNENDQMVACLVGAVHTLDVKLDKPVEAQVINNDVIVTWTTIQEDQVLGFLVKRKTGSGNVCESTLGYEQVGDRRSEGAGTEYTFTDYTVGVGSYCYMLQEIGDNGNPIPIAPENQGDFITSVTVEN